MGKVIPSEINLNQGGRRPQRPASTFNNKTQVLKEETGDGSGDPLLENLEAFDKKGVR